MKAKSKNNTKRGMAGGLAALVGAAMINLASPSMPNVFPGTQLSAHQNITYRDISEVPVSEKTINGHVITYYDDFANFPNQYFSTYFEQDPIDSIVSGDHGLNITSPRLQGNDSGLRALLNSGSTRLFMQKNPEELTPKEALFLAGVVANKPEYANFLNAIFGSSDMNRDGYKEPLDPTQLQKDAWKNITINGESFPIGDLSRIAQNRADLVKGHLESLRVYYDNPRNIPVNYLFEDNPMNLHGTDATYAMRMAGVYDYLKRTNPHLKDTEVKVYKSSNGKKSCVLFLCKTPNQIHAAAIDPVNFIEDRRQPIATDKDVYEYVLASYLGLDSWAIGIFNNTKAFDWKIQQEELTGIMNNFSKTSWREFYKSVAHGHNAYETMLKILPPNLKHYRGGVDNMVASLFGVKSDGVGGFGTYFSGSLASIGELNTEHRERVLKNHYMRFLPGSTPFMMYKGKKKAENVLRKTHIYESWADAAMIAISEFGAMRSPSYEGLFIDNNQNNTGATDKNNAAKGKYFQDRINVGEGTYNMLQKAKGKIYSILADYGMFHKKWKTFVSPYDNDVFMKIDSSMNYIESKKKEIEQLM